MKTATGKVEMKNSGCLGGKFEGNLQKGEQGNGDRQTTINNTKSERETFHWFPGIAGTPLIFFFNRRNKKQENKTADFCQLFFTIRIILLGNIKRHSPSWVHFPRIHYFIYSCYQRNLLK